jgi:hypothetical protein
MIKKCSICNQEKEIVGIGIKEFKQGDPEYIENSPSAYFNVRKWLACEDCYNNVKK